MALLWLITIISINIVIFIPIFVDNCTQWEKNAPLQETVDFINEFLQESVTIRGDRKSLLQNKHDMLDLQDDDIKSNITRLIEKDGYPVEEHEVVTIDGYVLKMFRIPGNGSVVFLMHGILVSSDSFCTPGEGHALAYFLSAQGYDVWLGNARGNFHSRRNINLSPDCVEFWDFSWDDIGRKDLPAMIDYVLKITDQKRLHYIGHSQGTTAFFVLCSELPEYNKKFSIMIALAPVAWCSHARSASFLLYSLFSDKPALFKNVFGEEFLPLNDYKRLTTIFCGEPETSFLICKTIIGLEMGFDYSQTNATYLPRVFAYLPAGASSKQALHYGQGVVSGKFRQYDYGPQENLKRYGSLSPPDYPVQNISTRIVFFNAEGDRIAVSEDVKTLINNLRNFNMSDFYTIPHPDFNHFDYIIANNIKTLVFDKILTYLKSVDSE